MFGQTSAYFDNISDLILVNDNTSLEYVTETEFDSSGMRCMNYYGTWHWYGVQNE